MQAISPEGIQSSLTSDGSTVGEVVESFVESQAQLAESLDAPESAVSDFRDSGKELAQLVEGIAQESAQARERAREAEARADDLEQEVADLEDRLDEQTDEAARDRAETKQRVSALEEADSGDETPTPETAETTEQGIESTPIEQLSQSDDVEEVTDSASVKRAVSLFENLRDWGQKAPKGIVLRPADNPLSLLEADRDESLCWKQYYRAAQTLERLSRGAVTFFDSDRHGKMLVLHEQSELHDRVTDGPLSMSSVGAEG
jgi:flagellar biosynthesis GTPase FlhF